MKTELEINQTLHEARGLCWHERDKQEDALIHNDKIKCGKCQKWVDYSIIGLAYYRPRNPSYTTSWSDYGPMLEWAMKQEWWSEFAYIPHDGRHFFREKVILNPLKGSTAIAEFLEERK